MASIEDRVRTVVCDIVDELSPHQLGDESNLIEAGVDSLDLLEVFFELNSIYEVDLPIEDWSEQIRAGKRAVSKTYTVAHIASAIRTLTVSPSVGSV